jgi:putative Holliday junction resolvase
LNSAITILAFDFGLKRIGVAVGNTLLKQAQALTVIAAESNNAKFDAIAALLKEWQVTHCVIGFPSHPDGVEHEMSARCRRFAHQLEGRFGVTTSLVDERYTSAVIASKRGDIIDALSAELILQQYFDEKS